MIEIKDISGQLRFTTPINKGAKGKFTLMKEDYIILPFSVSTPIPFKLGDYVDLSGVLDESLGGKLAKIYEITDLQKPTYNSSTGGYDYKLQMNAYYWKWKNKIFKYTPEHAGNEASWSLTASLDVQLGVFLRNLKALGYTYKGTDFTFSIDDSVENKAVAMTYDNMNLLDALFSMAGEDKWNCDCWITDNVIHFGRCEFGDPVKIERDVEASSVTRSESQGTYATRIYAFGSTKNIPTNYRPTDEQAVINGVVQKRLMLPADTPYIDAYEGMSQEEAIEDVVVFDGVYPRRVGTLSDVHTRTEEVENEDGTKDTVTYYRYKDTGLEFKEEYIIEGQELQITFQSGRLNGMVFGVIFNPTPKDETRGEQLWEIVRNEDYGRPLPDDMMYPANGDEYILSGFDIQLVSDQYIPAAEQELKQKAQKYADKVKKDDGTYPTTLRSDWVHEDLISRTFEFGQRINLVDDTYFENGRISRVLGWEMNLDIPWDSPVYTIGESMPYSRIGEIEDKVDALTYKGQTYTGGGGSGVYVIKVNDSTAPSDNNVFSALRSLATFLRKDIPDSTKHLLSLFGGAIFGEKGFAEGLLGFGAKIDSKGYGEMRRLKVWEELVVPLLVYNRVDVVIGDKWRAPGAGIIETVTPDTDAEGNTLSTGTATLKLEDGEIGAIAVDDMAMGIWHFGNGSDATEDSDDSKGNFTFAGFTTAYWRIIEVTGDDNKTFRYALRPGYTTHPQPQMTFSCRGNFTNEDRQKSVYETRTYTRMLHHQNEWEITASNIAMQYGDLSNLNVFGMNMEGYSMYLNSVYFTGTITQMKPDGTPIRTANDRGAWEYNTKYDYYDRVSHNGCIWLCVNEDGTDTEPSNDNQNWLLQVSKGEAGQDGTSFKILGSKNDESELPQEGNQVGDAYLINGDMWVWTEEGSWKNVGNIQGPAGESVQNMGGWYSGLFVPYLGVVRMGKGSFMCVAKNGTYNPPYYTLLDNSGNRIKTNDGYILTGEINNAEYQLIAADGTDGQDGMDGVPGEPGKDGKTYYTWIRYADDAEGNGISNDPTGKSFIGFAYNKESQLESNNPEDYIWSDIKGEQGVPGEVGADGKTYYTWIAYSDNPDGNPMYQQPNENTKYIGIAVNKESQTESSDPNDYTWSRFKGEQGDKGDKGDTGDSISLLGQWYEGMVVPYLGVVTMGGNSFAAKVATSNPPMWTLKDNNGNRIKSEKGYILTGEYNTEEYDLIAEKGQDGIDGLQGADGKDGIPGKDGADGKTSYFHIKYSENENGYPMTETPSTYIGTYVDFEEKDSDDYTKYAWARFEGIQGEKGEQGIPGYNGVDGKTYYLHIKYSNDGGVTFTGNNGEDSGDYIGVLTDLNPNDSTNPSDYKWSKIKGEQGERGLQGLQGEKGEQGIQGEKGEDGRTSYFHIKYSVNSNGNPMTEVPSTYIGTYVDFTEQDSSDYTKYTWSRFKGAQGEKGEQGIAGINGENGQTSYLHIAYSNSSDGSIDFSVSDSTNKSYIGQYTDFQQNDSTDYRKYSWTKIKGEQGDKGEGYTQLGQWYDGLLVPKMGVVSMGGGSYVAKVATYNPPLWTILDNQGRRIKSNKGYILTGGINTAEYDVWAEKGEQGDKGETGDKGDKGDKGDTGAQGKQGIDGCIVRDSEWTKGTEYRNDSSITDGSLPIRYIDIVLVRNDSAYTGWDAYQCKKTHVASDSITYKNASYWQPFGASTAPIFTSLILAKNAKINFLQGNQLLIQEDDGTITAGASGSNSGDAIRFWAGSQNPDDAPFRVNKKGKLFASGAEIEGTVTAEKLITKFEEISLPYIWYGSSSPSNISVRGRDENLSNVITLSSPASYNGVTIQIFSVMESRSDAPVYVSSVSPMLKYGLNEYLYYKLPTDKITKITSVLYPGGTYRWVIQDPLAENFINQI